MLSLPALGIRRLLAAIFIIGFVTMSAAQATDYWFAAVDPYARGVGRPDAAQDFLDLFTPTAPWTEAGHQLTVFKVGPGFVDYAPDEVLRQAFAELKRRGLALGWEMGVVPPGNCGRGEGYAGNTARSVGRIKAAGGELRYIAMDEPFWYGHHVVSKNTCSLPVDEVAGGVATQLAIVRAVFPDVQVGDIEPIGDPETKDYPAQMVEWAQAFQQATGRSLAFFHADIDWNGPWRQDLPILRQRLASLNIPLGVIINGDPFAKTDQAWTDAAIVHLQQVVDLTGVHPGAIIFQSWDNRPTRVLPEGQPGSLTNLVLQGTRPAANIALTPQQNTIAGSITDKSGKPVPGVSVDITTRDTGGRYGLRTVERTGTVPANAVKALFGLRVGVECDCGGPIDVEIGQLQYRDGSAAVVRFLQNGPEPYYLQSDTTKKVVVNTPDFAVKGGAPYAADVAMSVKDQASRAGYLAVFFIGADGREIRRDVIELKAAEQSAGKVVTDSAGRFSLRFPAGIDPAKVIVQAHVEASKLTRPTRSEIGPGAEQPGR